MRITASILLQSIVVSAVDLEESYHHTQLLQSKMNQGRVAVDHGGKLDGTTLYQHSIDLVSVMKQAASQKGTKAKRGAGPEQGRKNDPEEVEVDDKSIKKDLCRDPELYINGDVDFGDRETSCNKILYEEGDWIYDEARENGGHLSENRLANLASCCIEEVNAKSIKKDLCGDPERYVNGDVDFGERETSCDKILYSEGNWIYDEARENGGHLSENRRANLASCCAQRQDPEDGCDICGGRAIVRAAFFRPDPSEPNNEMECGGAADYCRYDSVEKCGASCEDLVQYFRSTECCAREPSLAQSGNVAHTNFSMPKKILNNTDFALMLTHHNIQKAMQQIKRADSN